MSGNKNKNKQVGIFKLKSSCTAKETINKVTTLRIGENNK